MSQEKEIPVVEATIVEALPQYYGLAGEREDSMALRRGILAAVALHLLILVVNWPFGSRPVKIREAGASRVFVMERVRFEPPKPQRREAIPERKAKKIPMPDPTPEDPEPIVPDEIEVPELNLPVDLDAVFGIPDAPPAPFGGPGVERLGGDILPPVKVNAPRPRYTEEARKARIQGVVLLETVIDALGNVTQVRVLKGLPMGLTESAVETVGEWTYKPATRDGSPVAVYLNVVVNFSLQ